jgi:uncharacterized protein (UPF0335 family)
MAVTKIKLIIPKGEIKEIIIRLEKLKLARKNSKARIAEAFDEAEDKGYDATVLKNLIKLRKLAEEERIRQEKHLKMYKSALDMNNDRSRSDINSIIAKDELEEIVVRLEKLEFDHKDASSRIENAFAEAKKKGYDIKVLKDLLKLRKLAEKERIRQEQHLKMYKSVLDMK